MQLAALGTAVSASADSLSSPTELPRRYVDCRDFDGLDPSGVTPCDRQINAAIAEGLAQHPKDPLPALFAAQQQMARAGDRAAHTVQEVLKKTSGE